MRNPWRRAKNEVVRTFLRSGPGNGPGARARIADPGKSTRSVNDAEAIKQRASRKASKVAVRVGKQDEDGYGECGEMKTHALTPHALQAEVADKSPPLDQSGKIWALEASRVESVGRVERQE